MTSSVADIAPHRLASIETRASWVIARTALAIYTVSFGAPVITVVALKPIAAELGDARSVPALACSLAWFGAAVGGIPMGWMAERFGIRRVVMFGAAMVAAGLAISTHRGSPAALYVGHGVFIGLLGNACINAPLYRLCRALVRPAPRQRGGADLVRPVPRRHGLAGPLLARHRGAVGWRGMMLGYAVFVVAVIAADRRLPCSGRRRTAPPPVAASGPLRGGAGARHAAEPGDGRCCASPG